MTAAAPTKTYPSRQPRPDIAARRQRVLTMRNAGATWAKIAETEHLSEQQVKNDYGRIIREVCKIPAEQLVERQSGILRDILRVEYPAAMDPSNPRHDTAVGRILEVLRDERKLFGLDAPTRINLGISEAEFVQQAKELLAATGTGPLRELVKGKDVVDAEVVSVRPEGWSNLD